MYKLFSLMLVLLFSFTIASTSHADADWLQEFNVSGFGNFNGLTANIVEGTTVFADIQDQYFHAYDGANSWFVNPKQNTSSFDVTTGTFHTTVDFYVYFSDPSSAPFKFDLEVWWEPSAINTSFPGYENYNTNQAPILLAIIHYAWNGNAWSSTVSTPPPPPTNVQASDGTYPDRVQVTWTGSSQATSYEVWRNTSNYSAAATKIAPSVSGTNYDDTTAFTGTTYYYWVQAVDSYGTKSIFSAPDTGFLAVTPPPPPPGNLLTVTKTGNGGGMITSSLPGINCGPDCSEIYAAGTSVTLTANSDATSRFGSWMGCDSESGNQCTVSMVSNRTVTATFVYRRLDILDIAVSGLSHFSG